MPRHTHSGGATVRSDASTLSAMSTTFAIRVSSSRQAGQAARCRRAAVASCDGEVPSASSTMWAGSTWVTAPSDLL
ncbi:hypothetical protein [Streptomyces sp. NPDC003635]